MPTSPYADRPEQPTGTVAGNQHAQHGDVVEDHPRQDRQDEGSERPDQQHGRGGEDHQGAQRWIAPDERDRLAESGGWDRRGDGAADGQVREREHDEAREHEQGDGHTERRADTVGRDEQAGRRRAEHVSDMLRGGEQGVGALTPESARSSRRRHQALPRGRARGVRERADDRQQHDLPDLQSIERKQDG